MPSSPSSPSSIPSADEVKKEVVEASKQTLSSLRSLAAGGVGGVCAVIVGHPFDLVKVRMQTAEKGVYTGAIDVVKKTVAREGLRKVRLHEKGVGESRLTESGYVCRRIGTAGGCDAHVCHQLLGLRCRPETRQILFSKHQ